MKEWRIDVLVRTPSEKTIVRHVYARPLISDSPMFKQHLDALGEQIEEAVREMLVESA